MTTDAAVKLLITLLGLLGTVAGIVGGLCHRFITYLFRRIDILEGREATVQTGIVESVTQQGAELAAQGALIRQLAEESKRREWLRDREKGGS